MEEKDPSFQSSDHPELSSECLPNFQVKSFNEIKVILLNNQQYLDTSLFRVKKGSTVEFHLGPTLFGKKINLYINYPSSEELEFDRKTFQLLQWKKNEKKNLINISPEPTTIFACLTVNRAGTFYYYFTQDKSEKALGCGYLVVDPVLCFGVEEIVALDLIRCQTVLSKSLGSFNEWESRLRVSKESGYNMIHFTPIQELGGSNSSYSLKNQLQLNPGFSSDSCKVTFEDVARLTTKMRREWKVLSICDLVLNHTANDSAWLESHPECTYNMITAPHLIPAAILDGHFHVFSKNCTQGKLLSHGIPEEISSEFHLNAVKKYLQTELIPKIRLHEFYMADVDKLAEEFLEKARNKIPSTKILDRKDLTFIGGICGRNQAKVDLELALEIFNVYRQDVSNEELRLAKCVEDFKKRIMELNSELRHVIGEHIDAAINNCIAGIRYYRVQEDGPKLREVSEKNPLIQRYFTGKFSDYDSIEAEVLSNGKFVMAHNGWVMNSDPLKNFADSDSHVYLRRELIAWGDSVKLRYGNEYSDCPFLWDLMRQYVQTTATIFDGIRLDNCHSTPLPVAEFLLDCARKIRPDLYVIAELFTNSDTSDNIFVNRLGITSLIREANSAWNSNELGRLVHRFGGEPVGGFFKSIKSLLVPSIPHAVFYDATHDNPSPIEKRSVFDLVPTAALVAMACCAIGSSRGYDELVPHHVVLLKKFNLERLCRRGFKVKADSINGMMINYVYKVYKIHVVDEKRLYPSWSDAEINDFSVVGINTGIIKIKKALNNLHEYLSKNGFDQVFVDQMNDSIVAVTRHNPSTHENIILVAHTAFSQPTANAQIKPFVRNLKFEGELVEILLEASFKSLQIGNMFSPPKNFQKSEAFINGLTDYKVILKENIKLGESEVLKQISSANETTSEFEFQNFPPGTIVCLRVKPHHTLQSSLLYLQQLKDSFLSFEFNFQTASIVSELNLSDLNYALYRCSQEDSEERIGSYNIPGFGSLVYCGIQGFESVLQTIRLHNDIGHPLCNNLREGDWMLDYVSGRLKSYKGTAKLGHLFQEMFDVLRLAPRYLIPKYFDVIISSMCRLLISRAAFQMSEFVRGGSTYTRHLAMGSVMCIGFLRSASLPPFSISFTSADDEKRKVTMCAGLPHFTVGYMRSWGRDTFISLRGLLLLTGRFEEAKFHILGYAACLRHGLIPNLLDTGINARYNCRDAVWWWLYSIFSYIDMVPKGEEILKEKVSRIYPTDDSPPMGPGLCDQPLYDIMQEALSIHFKGISFREKNAGPKIDAHMADEGFNNRVGVDLETGFVFGGNAFNCGTWMDKMGSDVRSGNRGKPATPRDGSAVELVALCKAVVKKLAQVHEAGFYPYSGVERLDENGSVLRWSFKDWEEKISSNFEKWFYIPESTTKWEKWPELIHRREIYKDSVGASQPWADYQFRCNFLIALVVAPEMVNHENAWKAIKKAEEILLGPLGIKTLDPADWNYNGDYRNDDDSGDPKVAHGFNYHQGPEWLWPVGFFLRAKIYFSKLIGVEEFEKAVVEVRSYLGNHYIEMTSSPWRGLPELTNKNGSYCSDGCRVQSWSMACFLEVLYDLHLLEQ